MGSLHNSLTGSTSFQIVSQSRVSLPSETHIGVNKANAGFIYFNNTEVLKTAVQDLTKWVEDGTISVAEAETVVDTVFEDIPKTWQRLFQGQNRGKLVTKLIQ